MTFLPLEGGVLFCVKKYQMVVIVNEINGLLGTLYKILV
jgi:hypothetical protein